LRQKGETVVFVPVAAHRGLHSVPATIARKLPLDATIHGLLAAELALRRHLIPEWAALMPGLAAFVAGLPFLWPAPLRALLPSPAAAIAAKHDAGFHADLRRFRAGFPDVDACPRDDFLLAWCLVNTRSFYFETPDMLRYPYEDRLTLLPLADLFNHAAVGCPVQFSSEGHRVMTDRVYRAGEELCTSYGDHSNDYLMAEYGFIMADNEWDTVSLDDLIIPKLSAEQKDALKKSGDLEDLTIGSAGTPPSSSLPAALRTLSPPASGSQAATKGAPPHDYSTGVLSKLLKEKLDQANDTLDQLQALAMDSDAQRCLEQRWKQIVQILTKATQNLHI
jgi:hypothetical protein